MAKDRENNEPKVTANDDEVSTPASLRGAAAVQDEVVEPDSQVEEARMSAKMRTKQTENQARLKAETQARINDRAKTFKKKHEAETDKRDEHNRLVWIRAMRTHQPPPTVGKFKFMDIYTNFIEGMKYLVPRYVAISLEETENCISFE